MSTLRLGRVARDRDAALEPHNGAAVGRQDLELLVLEVFRDGLKARGHVSRDRLAHSLHLHDVRGRPQVAEGARVEAKELDGGGHDCVCWFC